MKCKHCWVNAGRRSKDEVTLAEIENVINQGIKLGIKQIGVTGGEPFLRKEAVKRILQLCRQKSLSVAVETNASVLTQRDIPILKKINPKTEFSVSIDSIDEKFFEEFRGVKGSFKKVMETLKYLVEYDFPTQVIMTVVNSNINQIESVADVVLETIGADSLKIDPAISMGRAKQELQNILLDVEDIPVFIRKLKRVSQKYPRKIYTSLPPAFTGLYVKTIICDYKNLLGIMADGSISLCGIGYTNKEVIFGNIRLNSLDDVWKYNKILSAIRNISTKSVSGICKLCIFSRHCVNFCPAYVYDTYKTFFASHPICQMLYEKGLFTQKYIVRDDIATNILEGE